jgi:hypothetical protein
MVNRRPNQHDISNVRYESETENISQSKLLKGDITWMASQEASVIKLN